MTVKRYCKDGYHTEHKDGTFVTAEECGYVDHALAECERLKDAVKWERECRDTLACLTTMRANVRADAEMLLSLVAARKAVEELL